ncbi:MAG TPA: sodium/proton-translocating pyrophosphatase, partial [Streptosporangiaceae bacterium]|nr:sodium/proton-translocating pyrophosphatase [Streptosporangiaceae bacterium]
MINLLAAEGGYQAFHLGGVDKTWLYICLAAGVVGIGAGLLLARNVLAADQGTLKMREIAQAVQEGAEAFLARQFRAIVMIIIPLAILIFFTATKVVKPDGGLALSFQQDGLYRVLCFLAGAIFS